MAHNDPINNPESNNLTDALKDAAGSSSDTRRERRAMHDDRDRLVYDFKEMVSSAEALLRSTAKYTGAEVEDARERLQQQLDLARDRSGDVKETIRDAGQELMSRTDECVHKHPWQCIGIAFIAGMVFTHCTGRSRD